MPPVILKNGCVIKGYPNGLRLVLNPELPFDELLRDIQDNVHDAAEFFKDAKVVLSFEGRSLSPAEEREILLCVEKNSKLQIACIMDEDPREQALYRVTLKNRLLQLSRAYGNFYRGTLLAGQILESYQSIVILGDVKNGAVIRSVGSIIITGTLAGAACAGICGDEESFIAAMDFRPCRIRIGSYSKKRKSFSGRQREAFKYTVASVSDDAIKIHSI